MAGRRRQLPGTLSRLVASNVRRLAGEQDLPTAEVIRVAGFKPNYYYVRMRLEIGFSLGDLEALANALGVVPSALLETASGTRGPVRVDGSELSARLCLLVRTYGHKAGPDAVVDAIRHAVPDFTAQTWATLTSSTGVVFIDPRVLDATADYFDVDPAYLTEPIIDDAVDRVKAELELQDALRAVGATTVAARSLGEASPTALRAIATALRTRPGV